MGKEEASFWDAVLSWAEVAVLRPPAMKLRLSARGVETQEAEVGFQSRAVLTDR